MQFHYVVSVPTTVGTLSTADSNFCATISLRFSNLSVEPCAAYDEMCATT